MLFWTLLSQVYQTLLALAVVTASPKVQASRAMYRHALTILLAYIWIILAIRDLLPLATFHGHSVDDTTDPFLWAILGVLTLVAVVIPLITPQQFDPLEPLVSDFVSRRNFSHVDTPGVKTSQSATNSVSAFCDSFLVVSDYHRT